MTDTKAAKCLVFYFNFYDENTETESTYGFIVNNPGNLYAKTGVAGFHEFNEILYDDITEKLESEFGVHDWSSSPNEAVNAIGYTTYEVETDDIPVLMNKWSEWFSNNGGEPTPVVLLSEEAAQGDDLSVFEFILDSQKKKPRPS